MAKGTNIRPPIEVPTVFIEIAVARLRLNHLDINAMVLVNDGPLNAVESKKLKTTNMKSIWKVKLNRSVKIPISTRPTTITRRPPMRSKRCPKNGWVIPLIRKPEAAANEIVVLVHPNSSLIGITKIPKAFLTPTVKNAMKKQVATIYQPKKIGESHLVPFIIKSARYRWARIDANKATLLGNSDTTMFS